MPTVHFRVNDAATGRPTPCRVRFTNAAGLYCPPLGRLAEFATETGADVGGNVLLGGKEFAVIDGTCEVPLTPGRLTVEVHKGPEYIPLREELNLAAGRLALRLSVRRWVDLREDGWYSGDTWAEFLTPDAALLEAAAEDVAVVNLLASATDSAGGRNRRYRAFANLLSFSGQNTARELPGHLVSVNTLNRHRDLGCLALLHCHRVVYPLESGRPGEADDWTLADWCDQCHRKGGLVVGHEFFGDHPGRANGETLADLILEKIDALEMTVGGGHPDELSTGMWPTLLDAGFRVPLVGGSGKTDNRCVLGIQRTYARLAAREGLSYKAWVEAVRAGRTFVTNGPLLRFTVNGKDPGAIVDLSTGVVVRVRAEARGLAPLRSVEVVYNGRVLATAVKGGGLNELLVDEEFLPPGPGWMAARCRGDYDEAGSRWVGAQTSPVYLTFGGSRRIARGGARDELLLALERSPGDGGRSARVREVHEAARKALLERVPT